MEVGFGSGRLRLNHHISVVPGAPYVLAGRDMGPYGIPHIDSRTFEWANPGKDLTFHWFKHNIMCRDNAWICEDDNRDSRKKKDYAKSSDGSSGSGSQKGSKLSGSKKNRRKNKARNEFRRRLLSNLEK